VASALGFAHPAHADTTDTPDPSAVATVTGLDPAALADAATAAATGGTANISVSVRIGSPGDNGDVSQSISVSTGSADQQSTGTSTQNVSISVRINSPGSNGTVTQTSSSATAPAPSTSTQYQQPATQYPAPSKPTTSTAAPDPAPAASQPAPSSAPDAAPAPQATAPLSSWIWNLTVSGCGDTSSSDITQPIDTGIQGWIWNWNIGTICQDQAPSSPNNPQESDAPISPQPWAAPDPPAPPSVEPPQVLILPSVPQPAIVGPPTMAVVVPMLGAVELPASLMPVELPALPQVGYPLQPRRPQHHKHVAAKTPRRSGVLGAAVALQAPPPLTTVTPPVRDSRPEPQHRSVAHKAPPWESLALILDSSFSPAPAGASAGGGGASGGAGGAAAALSLWLLLQLPGFATLRLPARQRRPRGRVDEMQTRPG
jgi:hypothetical protein